MNTGKFIIEDYIDILSDKAAVPGGGGAAALVGALGIALTQMVSNLTIGKKAYFAVENDIKRILSDMQKKRERFLELANLDAEVFLPLSKAYSIKAETEEEKRKKSELMEDLLLSAARIPFEVLELSVSTLDDIDFLALNGSKIALSDVGVAISFIRSVVAASYMNIRVNLKLMKNREVSLDLETRAKLLFDEAVTRADIIYDKTLERL